MSKKLSEMTLEELWELFPIILTEHKSEWSNYYFEMEAVLKEKLCDRQIVQISHIGSTAIKGIWAKPIVDILVEIPLDENMQAVAEQIEKCGFLRMSEEKGRISFNKGYTENGFDEKVYHLHLRFAGDNDECYFCDYMNAHPQLAKEYERLKLRLWRQFEHNRDGYTNAKADFINKYTVEAKKQYIPRGGKVKMNDIEREIPVRWGGGIPFGVEGSHCMSPAGYFFTFF